MFKNSLKHSLGSLVQTKSKDSGKKELTVNVLHNL